MQQEPYISGLFHPVDVYDSIQVTAAHGKHEGVTHLHQTGIYRPQVI